MDGASTWLWCSRNAFCCWRMAMYNIHASVAHHIFALHISTQLTQVLAMITPSRLLACSILFFGKQTCVNHDCAYDASLFAADLAHLGKHVVIQITVIDDLHIVLKAFPLRTHFMMTWFWHSICISAQVWQGATRNLCLATCDQLDSKKWRNHPWIRLVPPNPKFIQGILEIIFWWRAWLPWFGHKLSTSTKVSYTTANCHQSLKSAWSHTL